MTEAGMGHDGTAGAALEALLTQVEPPEPGFGAGVAVARAGELLGIAWTGEAAPGRDWTAATPLVTWSVSKGVASMVVARLVAEGKVDIDAPIGAYWTGFGGTVGSVTTLADVMTHRAGLPALPEAPGLPSFAAAGNWTATKAIDEALAGLRPVPELEGSVAYHALTFGWLVDACIRRATGGSLDEHLQRMISPFDGLELGFGTRSAERCAALARPGVPEAGGEQAAGVDAAFADPGNLLRAALAVPPGMTFGEVLRTTTEPEFLAAETPAISLISDAGSLARIYSLFSAGDTLPGPALIGSEGRDRALELRAATEDDGVTGGARRMALGFVQNSAPSINLAPAARAFGHPGMGGSLAWGDPDSGLGFAYLTNAAIPDTVTDARAMALSRLAWDSAAG